MFPYPSIRTLGLELDPKTKSTVKRIYENSQASKSDIKVGDELTSLNKTLVSSEADAQWILHNLPSGDSNLSVGLKREGRNLQTSLTLQAGWRKGMQLTWRPTSWEFFRMATGGMKLEAVPEKDRKELGIGHGKMALKAIHVGMYGQHARAKRAGLQKGDIVVGFDGHEDLMTNNALLEHAIQKRKPGDIVKIKYMRNGKVRETQIKLQ